ncbi:MAG: universal stress protein [Candidatus Bipolaricaulota bacterium]
MLPVKRILCPTDFSEPSQEALDVAVEFAHLFQAELLVVHVVSPVPTVAAPAESIGFDVGAYQQGLSESAERSLDELVKERVPANIVSHYMVAHGDAAHEIIRLAEKNSADLIITATRGASGWRAFMFGSVAERIVRTSPYPVLTVPPPGEESDDT